MALGTQPLTETSPRSLPWGRVQPSCKVGNLTDICEPNMQEMWDHQRVFMACYRDSFTLFIRILIQKKLREEHRLKVLESRVLRRIFGKNRDKVMGGWRKLHNQELCNLYSLPRLIRMMQSRRIRWAGQVVQMWEKRNAYRLLVGKPEGQRPLGRPRCRWMDIKMDLGETEWGKGLTGLFWLMIGTSGELL
jgi:hypothetical protein